MKNLKLILNNKGLAIIQVVVLASVVAGLGAVMVKSGLIRSKITKQAKEEVFIKEFLQEVNSALADSEVCKASMDDNFQSITGFSTGSKPDSNVNIILEEFSLNQDLGRVKEIGVLLSKQDIGKETRKSFLKKVRVQTYIKKDVVGNETMYCTSYENEQVEKSYEYFCELYGGDYDNSVGSCNFNSMEDGDFKDSIKDYACEVLGGELAGDKCNGVEISGILKSGHFDSQNQIQLGATARTDIQTQSCTGTQVATGITSDGALICEDISCPQLSSSTYLAIEDSGEIKCQCQRDSTVEKPSMACGATDNSSCTDYVVNDGCGLGQTCTIYGGKTTGCSGVPPVCIPNCPASSSVCTGETDTRLDGCGNSCNVVGTKTCSASLCSGPQGNGNLNDEVTRETIGGPCTSNGATLAKYRCSISGSWNFVSWEGCP